MNESHYKTYDNLVALYHNRTRYTDNEEHALAVGSKGLFVLKTFHIRKIKINKTIDKSMLFSKAYPPKL